MEKKHLVFEVETYYLNGAVKAETIAGTSEENMWQIYDEIHAGDKNLIGSHSIIGRWIH